MAVLHRFYCSYGPAIHCFVMGSACLIIFVLVCLVYGLASQLTAILISRRSVNLATSFFLGKLKTKRLTSTQVHMLSLVCVNNAL